jgi:hypothetical protein
MSELEGLTVRQIMRMCDKIDEALESVENIDKISNGEDVFVSKDTLKCLVDCAKAYENILLDGDVKL